MKRLLLLFCLVLIPFGARADWPAAKYRIIYADDYRSGSTTAGIQQAINACGKGTNSYGCKIILPRQTNGPTCTEITAQIVIGDESGTTNKQNSITLEGHGFGKNDASGSRICYIGSSLAAGEGVLQITGSNHRLIGFDVVANDLADYGVHIEGSNAAGAITNGGVIRDFGCSDARVACIQFGDGTNDVQADLFDIDNVRITEPDNGTGTLMDYCIKFDAPNAVTNTIHNLECSYYELAGISIPGTASATGGSFRIYDSVFLTLNNSGDNSWAIYAGPNNTDEIAIFNNRFELDDGGCFNRAYLGGGTQIWPQTTFIGNACQLGDASNTAAHMTYDADSPLVMIGNSFIERSNRTSPPASRVSIGNTLETTRDLHTLIQGNAFGGAGTRPYFGPTINNTVAVNDVKANPAASNSVSNTTTETAFNNCDDQMFLASSLVVGTTVRFTAGGSLSTDAATPGTLAFRIRFGTANTDALLVDMGQSPTLATSLSNDGWRVQAEFSVRAIGASGTSVGSGTATIASSTADASSITLNDQQSGTTTIDTTATKNPTLFVKWSAASASNTIAADYCVVEVVRQ